MTSRPPFRPLYATPRSPERPTLGPRVAEIAEALGRPLMPHQRAIVDVALEIEPSTGVLAYSEVDLIGPRQVTGKTELLLPVMAHRCMGFGPQLVEWVRGELGVEVPEPGPQAVLYVAQNSDESRKKWRRVHLSRLKNSPFAPLIRETLTANQEVITWRNGSTWSPGSTTGRKAGTGDTLDLPVIDEAWSRPGPRTELGMRPAMMTRPWSQLWVTSMVPGPSRIAADGWPYLAAKIVAGRARVEAGVRRDVAYFELSASEDLDPGSPDTWWTCMAGLGRTVSEDRVRADFERLPLPDFCAEYLGWLPNVNSSAPRWLAVAEDTWTALHDPRSTAVDPVAFGVAATPDGSAVSICAAGLRPMDDDLHIELVQRRAGIEFAARRVVQLAKEHGGCAIGLRLSGPSRVLVRPIRNELERQDHKVQLVTANNADYQAGCKLLYLATGQEPDDGRRVRHLAQPDLTAAMSVCTWKLGMWESSHPAVDIDTVEAATMAVLAGDEVNWSTTTGDFDIMRTLG